MVIITRSELRKIKAIEKKIQQEFLSKNIPDGIEICEIQLYHLANKIKETKINKEIESYLPAINDVLEGIDRDELIKKIVSVEFTQFYNYYSKSKDLNSQDSGRERGTSKGDIPSEGSVRYFINVGERDGYDWMSLKDFLRDTLNLEKEDVYNVDTKDTFSFFNTDAQLTELILQTFTDFKLEGRFINVEVSKNPGAGGGGKGGKKRRGRKGGGGGHRKGGNSYKGGKKGGYGKKGGKKKQGFY